MSPIAILSNRKTVVTAVFCLAVVPLAVAIAATLDQSAVPCPEPMTGWTRHAAVAEHVILVSIDGLHPEAIDALGPKGAPHLHRIRKEGATTDNARTDHAYTVTLPNHVSQLTARGVAGACGHNWTVNSTPPPGTTIHINKGGYVFSIFDVLADAGLQAAVFASKPKFSLFPDSYNPERADDQRAKITPFVYVKKTDSLVSAFVEELTERRFGFGFLHLRDPDSHGHGSGWDLSQGSAYLASVRKADSLVGVVLGAVDGDSLLRRTTAVLVTSDHGGDGHGHGDARNADVYTIPFYAWGAGVDGGVDLYAINQGSRLDPGRGRPDYRTHLQPIRNGDAANLALDLLGLPNIPGSTINTHAAPLVTSHADMLHAEMVIEAYEFER